MTAIEKLEHEVKKLKPSELAAFRRWFARFDAEVWDRQIAMDAKSGRLAKSAAAALREHKAGKSKEL